jgi:predicted cobalt transporter CbtA
MPPIPPEVTSRQLEEALSPHEHEEEEETHADGHNRLLLHIPELATALILIALLLNLSLMGLRDPGSDNRRQNLFLFIVLLLCVFDIRKQIMAMFTTCWKSW